MPADSGPIATLINSIRCACVGLMVNAAHQASGVGTYAGGGGGVGSAGVPLGRLVGLGPAPPKTGEAGLGGGDDDDGGGRLPVAAWLTGIPALPPPVPGAA